MIPVRGRYEAATHTYWRGGQMVWSVTGLLKRAGHIDTTWMHEDARERGRIVHDLCAGIDFGLEMTPEADAFAPWLDGYLAMLREIRPEWMAIEEPHWHASLPLAGRPDRVASSFVNGASIVEIKTGGSAAWHDLQTAGYQLLVPTGERWVVYLPGDHTYKLRRCADGRDMLRVLDLLKEYPCPDGARRSASSAVSSR